MSGNQNLIVKLREKEFRARNSLLTDLFETEQGSSIYNFIVNLVILCGIGSMCKELFQNESDRLQNNVFIRSLRNFDKALLIWVCIFSSTLIAYTAFYFWTLLRSKVTSKCVRVCWDMPWIIIFVCYIIILMGAVPFLLGKINATPASHVFLLIEQVRLVMKVYAFVRSNVPRVIKNTVPADENVIVPKFQQYLYYLFAPTLIYKDSYPRTEKIRYKFVIYRLLEVAICIYICNLLYSSYYPIYYDFGLKPYAWQSVTSLILTSLLGGPVIVCILFFMVLHSWQNAFAEILRFADRKFYLDWWTTKEYVIFFRFWNIIIHDFLHTYVYKDLYESVFPGNKTFSMLVVFIVSGCFHEYIAMFSLGFCLPIMFLLFCGGIVFSICKKYTRFINGNVFILFSHTWGNGLIASLYALEYFVRVNCPKEDASFLDFFVPRLITCNFPQH